MTQPQIIRGTTPTITFTFRDISVSDIDEAYLVIKQANENVIELPLSYGAVSSTLGTISWSLTQQDTLSLSSTIKRAVVVCDWVTFSGLRGRSVELNVTIGEPGKNEVINTSGGGGAMT